MIKPKVKLILLSTAIVVTGILLYIFARLGCPVPCIFNKITGLYCPGCGNTRAVLELINGNFLKAFSHNYLFPLEILYLGFVYIHSGITCLRTGRFSYRSPVPALDWIVLGILVLWWILRNILHI